MTQNEFLADTKPVDHDNPVDAGIRELLHLGTGKSFITFAGAGSGKTYSLERALRSLKAQYEGEFLRDGKQVAVITFTNNAADEISERVERSPVLAISTIHSFCWTAISGFNEDIRKWYKLTIPSELEDLRDKERRGRAGAASDARKRSIVRLTMKMEWLSEPRNFVYDPNGVNSAQNALAHAEVLKIFAHFLTTKPMMAEVLANKYPFIFVDESQDTDRVVVNALFSLHKAKTPKIAFGFFGDTMQRIFGSGEPELGKSLPSKWIEFDKHMNHRSARRIVALGNRIRSEGDGRFQYAREGAGIGTVRFFLLPRGLPNKAEAEANIRLQMAEISNDPGWQNPRANETAVLLLEHKMVSRRLGFENLADTLAQSALIRDRIFEGENSELNYFANIVFPLAEASRADDKFEVMTILRANKSPLLEEEVLSQSQDDPLLTARAATEAFRSKVEETNVSLLEVLTVVANHLLLPIPPKLMTFVASPENSAPDVEVDLDVELGQTDAVPREPHVTGREGDEFEAWTNALRSPFYELKGYRDYINENAIFRTHQGVKGNEFQRVMVIMDDDDAGGFMFSYEQFFGVKELSKETKAKMVAGEDTGFDRTRRLFYVTSTRAKSSLAHVIYTANVEEIRNNLLHRKLAVENEIMILDPSSQH